MKNLPKLTVYRASAGSGKTFTLAAEYIALLLRGTQWSEKEHRHRHILAITFTNKATAEMKDRILQCLDRLRQGVQDDFAKAVLLHTPGVEFNELARRAGLALDSIIHDYDRFYVETIDKFFQSLLANMAHELHLPANLKVDINDGEVADQAVDRLLQGLDKTPQLRAWVADYIRLRVSDNKNWRIADEIKKFARTNVLSEKYQMNAQALHAKVSENAWMNNYRSHLYALRREALSSLAALGTPIIEAMDAYDAEDFNRKGQVIRNHIAKNVRGDMAEAGATIKGNIEKPESIISAKRRKDPAYCELATRLSAALAEFEEHRAVAETVINSCDLTLRNFNPLRLLHEISTLMDIIDGEHSRFLLARTKLLFHEMVTGTDAPFIFEKAGTHFRHVMIDEFQDTARTQWDNIRTLLLDKVAAGDDCLLVGDIKQSIYRWNGGDWKILRHIEEEFPAGVHIEPLDSNHRSDGRIVRFNNDFFLCAAKELDAAFGSNEISEIYEDVTQKVEKHEESGYVRIAVDTSKKGDFGPLALPGADSSIDTDNSLAGQIRRLVQAGIPYTQMAILVRQKGETQALLQHFALHAPDIRLVSDEAFFLSASPAIMLLINTLRYLNDGKNTAAQAYMAQTYQHYILQSDVPLGDITMDRSRFLPTEIETERELLRQMPLYELLLRLMELYEYSRLLARPETRGQAAFIASLLDEVLDYLGDNTSELSAFLTHWDKYLVERAIPSAEADGIRIMTIHKSKGLAFHTVFIPFCDWETEGLRMANREIEWWKPEGKDFNGLPLVPVTPTAKAARSIYAAQYTEELLQRRIDNLNIAYVAFTRPKRNLLVWCSVKEPDKKKDDHKIATIGELVYKAMQSPLDGTTARPAPDYNDILLYESGMPTADLDNGAPVTTEEAVLQIHPTKAEFRQSRNSEIYIDGRAATADGYDLRSTARGKLYHRIFEEIRTREDITPAITTLRQRGIIPHSIHPDGLERYIRNRIAHTDYADPRVISWFSGEWTPYNECSILLSTAEEGFRAFRPDRVMTRGDETVVVDFKFAHENEEYHEQVRKYMRLLERMGRPHVRGYLWYVDQNKVEKVFPENAATA
ncbi:MAG: UvrD-helicase domain-containing protein [Alloprevotella sp.]|nr:UvrD-helicase domain-containing protein [Alloprevotella sp.]